jgi:hypothetical protein
MPCIRWLALGTVGLLLVACDEEVAPNQPPTVDWALSVPAEDSLAFERMEQESMLFDVSDAAEDPEGDSVYTMWYGVDSEGSPHFLFGLLTMKLDQPCDLKWFATAHSGSVISIVVVVSDHDLTWAPDVDETQPVQTAVDVDGTAFPLIKRVWTVELLNNCP